MKIGRSQMSGPHRLWDEELGNKGVKHTRIQNNVLFCLEKALSA